MPPLQKYQDQRCADHVTSRARTVKSKCVVHLTVSVLPGLTSAMSAALVDWSPQAISVDDVSTGPLSAIPRIGLWTKDPMSTRYQNHREYHAYRLLAEAYFRRTSCRRRRSNPPSRGRRQAGRAQRTQRKRSSSCCEEMLRRPDEETGKRREKIYQTVSHPGANLYNSCGAREGPHEPHGTVPWTNAPRLTRPSSGTLALLLSSTTSLHCTEDHMQAGSNNVS